MVGEVEPDQLADEARLHRPVLGKPRRQAVDQFGLGGLGAVAVGDLQTPGEQVAQQPIRLQLAGRVGPAEQQPEGTRIELERGLELVHQPALAQARIGHHRDGAHLARAGRGVECGAKSREFEVAPDHRRGVALHLQRRLRLHVEPAAHMQVSVVADAQAAGRCTLLHARGDVDGAAADRAAFVDPAAEQHAAGVDAHAHIEAGMAEAAPHRLALGPAFGQQRQAGVHGALRVVFVRALGAEGREQAVHDLVDVLGVEVLAECGGADHVEAQHGDLLEQLLQSRGCA